MKNFKVGDKVRMNQKFLDTLNPDVRRNEKRKVFTITEIKKWNDAEKTVTVSLKTARTETGCAASWIEKI